MGSSVTPDVGESTRQTASRNIPSKSSFQATPDQHSREGPQADRRRSRHVTPTNQRLRAVGSRCPTASAGAT